MKKIMFNDKYGLTQAVLEGRKTQTRRIINAPEGELDPCYFNGTLRSVLSKDNAIAYFPTYKIGEEVAIAQCYRDIMSYYHSLGRVDTRKISEQELVFWNAMREFESHGNDSAMRGDDNKMFVRADLMPHRIKITNVRVERLQDISEEDCLKEGIHVDDKAPEGVPLCKYIAYSYDADPSRQKKRWWFDTPRDAFAKLIDKTCGCGTWHSNPWVFVYDFILVK